MKVAVIGCGGHAQEHFRMIAAEPDCILGAQTPWSTLEDAVHTMRLGEAIGRGHKGPI